MASRVRVLMFGAIAAPFFCASGLEAQMPERSGDVSRPAWLDEAVADLEPELVARHGEAQRERTRRGLKQVADFWRE